MPSTHYQLSTAFAAAVALAIYPARIAAVSHHECTTAATAQACADIDQNLCIWYDGLDQCEYVNDDDNSGNSRPSASAVSTAAPNAVTGSTAPLFASPSGAPSAPSSAVDPIADTPSASPTNCFGVVEPDWCQLQLDGVDIFDCSYPQVRAICQQHCGLPCSQPPTIAPTAPTGAPTPAPTGCEADINEVICAQLFTRSNNATATAPTDECCTRPQLALFCPTTCCGRLDSCAPTASPTISTASPTTSEPTTSEPTRHPTSSPSPSPTTPTTSSPTAAPSCTADVFDACSTDQCCNPVWGAMVRRNCATACCGLTCAPTSTPTPAPTSLPTGIPTPSPTPSPSSTPTPLPTAAPTLRCANDSVPAALAMLIEPCANSCCAADPQVQLLAAMFCSASCCHVTCSPTPSPTEAPTAPPATSEPTPAPTVAPTVAPSCFPDLPSSGCDVALCCHGDVLVNAISRLECQSTCCNVGCEPTPQPTEAPTTGEPTPAPILASTRAPTTSEPTPTPTATPTTPQPTEAPITSEPTPAPTPAPAPTATPPVCSAITCGAQCIGHCGWSTRHMSCIDGAFTKPTEVHMGEGCVPWPAVNPDADTDAECRAITCSQNCFRRCGWSRRYNYCKLGGNTNSAEYNAAFGCTLV